MSPAVQEDVCKKLGISLKTYYNILNGEPVSIKTKQRLIEFAKSKGYIVKDVKGKLTMTKINLDSPEVYQLLLEMNENIKYLIAKK